MKRAVLTLLMAGLIGVGAAHAEGLYYGPRVGMNIGNVTKTTYAKSRVRGQFGAMAGYGLSDVLGVQAELLYSLQGYKMRKSDEKFTLNYIKIPVLAKAYIIEGLNVEAGISFNFLTKAEYEYKDVNGRNVSTSVKDYVKKFDLSIPVGINYQFRRWFDVGIRYDISTIRVPKDSDHKARNANWAISAGFRF